MPGRSYDGGSGYRYGFNGMESNEELASGSSYDFGARMYDARIGRFLKTDRYESKFPNQSPYLFAGNMPIIATDMNGDSLYILIHTQGYARGDDMFKAAAYTRKLDIERNSGFDEFRDKVVVLEVSDLSDIANLIDNAVCEYSAKYGDTVEFGLWGHSGLDGPTGGEQTTSNALDSKQMTLEGWKAINFNWSNEGKCRASFYGCRGAVETEVKKWVNNYVNENGILAPEYNVTQTSFAKRISDLPNFADVLVSGQISYSYPSIYTNYRDNIGAEEGDFFNENDDGSISFQRTYLVGGKGRSSDWNLNEQNVAYPMRFYKNGSRSSINFQNGNKN